MKKTKLRLSKTHKAKSRFSWTLVAIFIILAGAIAVWGYSKIVSPLLVAGVMDDYKYNLSQVGKGGGVADVTYKDTKGKSTEEAKEIRAEAQANAQATLTHMAATDLAKANAAIANAKTEAEKKAAAEALKQAEADKKFAADVAKRDVVAPELKAAAEKKATADDARIANDQLKVVSDQKSCVQTSFGCPYPPGFIYTGDEACGGSIAGYYCWGDKYYIINLPATMEAAAKKAAAVLEISDTEFNKLFNALTGTDEQKMQAILRHYGIYDDKNLADLGAKLQSKFKPKENDAVLNQIAKDAQFFKDIENACNDNGYVNITSGCAGSTQKVEEYKNYCEKNTGSKFIGGKCFSPKELSDVEIKAESAKVLTDQSNPYYALKGIATVDGKTAIVTQNTDGDRRYTTFTFGALTNADAARKVLDPNGKVVENLSNQVNGSGNQDLNRDANAAANPPAADAPQKTDTSIAPANTPSLDRDALISAYNALKKNGIVVDSVKVDDCSTSNNCLDYNKYIDLTDLREKIYQNPDIVNAVSKYEQVIKVDKNAFTGSIWDSNSKNEFHTSASCKEQKLECIKVKSGILGLYVYLTQEEIDKKAAELGIKVSDVNIPASVFEAPADPEIAEEPEKVEDLYIKPASLSKLSSDRNQELVDQYNSLKNIGVNIPSLPSCDEVRACVVKQGGGFLNSDSFYLDADEIKQAVQDNKEKLDAIEEYNRIVDNYPEVFPRSGDNRVYHTKAYCDENGLTCVNTGGFHIYKWVDINVINEKAKVIGDPVIYPMPPTNDTLNPDDNPSGAQH
jgi:hypothetical protein